MAAQRKRQTPFTDTNDWNALIGGACSNDCVDPLQSPTNPCISDPSSRWPEMFVVSGDMASVAMYILKELNSLGQLKLCNVQKAWIIGIEGTKGGNKFGCGGKGTIAAFGRTASSVFRMAFLEAAGVRPELWPSPGEAGCRNEDKLKYEQVYGSKFSLATSAQEGRRYWSELDKLYPHYVIERHLEDGQPPLNNILYIFKNHMKEVIEVTMNISACMSPPCTVKSNVCATLVRREICDIDNACGPWMDALAMIIQGSRKATDRHFQMMIGLRGGSNMEQCVNSSLNMLPADPNCLENPPNGKRRSNCCEVASNCGKCCVEKKLNACCENECVKEKKCCVDKKTFKCCMKKCVEKSEVDGCIDPNSVGCCIDKCTRKATREKCVEKVKSKCCIDKCSTSTSCDKKECIDTDRLKCCIDKCMDRSRSRNREKCDQPCQKKSSCCKKSICIRSRSKSLDRKHRHDSEEINQKREDSAHRRRPSSSSPEPHSSSTRKHYSSSGKYRKTVAYDSDEDSDCIDPRALKSCMEKCVDSTPRRPRRRSCSEENMAKHRNRNIDSDIKKVRINDQENRHAEVQAEMRVRANAASSQTERYRQPVQEYRQPSEVYRQPTSVHRQPTDQDVDFAGEKSVKKDAETMSLSPGTNSRSMQAVKSAHTKATSGTDINPKILKKDQECRIAPDTQNIGTTKSILNIRNFAIQAQAPSANKAVSGTNVHSPIQTKDQELIIKPDTRNMFTSTIKEETGNKSVGTTKVEYVTRGCSGGKISEDHQQKRPSASYSKQDSKPKMVVRHIHSRNRSPSLEPRQMKSKSPRPRRRSASSQRRPYYSDIDERDSPPQGLKGAQDSIRRRSRSALPKRTSSIVVRNWEHGRVQKTVNKDQKSILRSLPSSPSPPPSQRRRRSAASQTRQRHSSVNIGTNYAEKAINSAQTVETVISCTCLPRPASPLTHDGCTCVKEAPYTQQWFAPNICYTEQETCHTVPANGVWPENMDPYQYCPSAYGCSPSRAQQPGYEHRCNNGQCCNKWQ